MTQSLKQDSHQQKESFARIYRQPDAGITVGHGNDYSGVKMGTSPRSLGSRSRGTSYKVSSVSSPHVNPFGSPDNFRKSKVSEENGKDNNGLDLAADGFVMIKLRSCCECAVNNNTKRRGHGPGSSTIRRPQWSFCKSHSL